MEIYLDEEKIEKSNRNITDIADILNASPDRFQLKKKNINDIIRPTKSYLLKRFHAPASLLKKDIYAEAVASGQTNEFIKFK